MDVKNLRTETALSERNNDGSKYTQGGITLQCNRNKSYQDIGSNPLAKAEPIPVRPCAVIGPDRVVPPTSSNDPYLKKGPVEWLSPENGYRRPPEYPHKICNQNPSRNISPRQTFQENMQRIMVPPTYKTTRHIDDANFNHIQDRNIAISKNVKTNMAPEAKYCDVPYSINTLANEPKNIRDTDIYVPSANLPLTRTASHVWPPGVNVHAARTYGTHELYQYPQYPSCAGQRPTVIPINRPHRTIQEDASFVYPDHYYQDAGARFKPYPPPPVKERYPQPRYEYIGNYPSQFHPPPPLKYDMSKSGSSHPYSVYPHLKYLENRVPDHNLEGFQRPPTNQQPHYNLQFHNQVIHPTYAPMPGNSSQNKVHPYPLDGSVKAVASSKLHYDNSSKMYIDYENARNKTYPMADNYVVNEMGRVHTVKNQMVMPNYSPVGMHSIPSQQYYRKDNTQMKPFEYMPHFRNFEPHLNNSAILRHAPQFSPNTLAISPTESSISNNPSQIHGNIQEDCGYVSQSSTASVRSIDSGIYRLPHEYYKRYDFRYGPIVGSSNTLTKSDLNSNNVNSKENKQQIDVRQFLQMWNEGEEENNCENNNSKEIVIQTGSSETSNLPKQHLSNQDQLYVLGLVNVPSEELSKYEHIQKISKLPENIKGYNNLELLSQFEEVIESSNTSSFKSIPKEYQMTSKENSTKHVEALPRPLSPLDVESKISQSVIHKEVGCNFEIRPCSPQMLNVEIAAPAHNVLGERVIEKVTNPLSKIVKSPIPIKSDENSNCHTIKRQESNFTINDNPSCKMIRSPYATNNMNSVKTSYSLQDLEINSGVCLASLPRLDNEIELNFPEVNQQFINDNKKDSNFTTSNCPHSNIGEESNLPHGKLVKMDLEKDKVLVEETDKTFTKLSKYRKLKTNAAGHSTNNQLTKAVRTDSVIIKNPENIKNIEDKLLENSSPINLSSQSSVCHDLPNTLENNVDIALDFSLNKSGNNLPVIEIEKVESTKSFAAHLSLSCENVSSADPGKSCNENTNFDNKILNQKNTNIKFIKANNQGVKMHAGTINEDAIKSDVEKNVTDTLISDNTCSDNLIFEDTAPTNKHLSINYDSHHVINHDNKISDSVDTCNDNEIANSKKHDTYEDTASVDAICYNISNLSDSENRSNLVLPHTEIVPKYTENRLPMRFIGPENENIVSRKLNKFVITPQKDDDFEHDEISASLEKLFQESVEDTVIADSDNVCFDNSMSSKTLSCQQSKELYSPWIQKLLTHSEGLCLNTDIFKGKHSKNTYIDNNTGPTGLLAAATTSNEILIKKTTDKLTPDAKRIKEADSYATNRKPHTVIDKIKATCVNFNHDDDEDEIQDSQIIPKETDSVVNKSSVDKSSSERIADTTRKINPECDVETKKGDKTELNTLQDLESINELLNYDSNISTDESADNKMKTTYCETNTGSATCETFHGINSACNPENVTKVDSSSSSFADTSQFVSSNDQNKIEKNLRRKFSIKNMITTHGSNPNDTLEKFDSNTVHESHNIIHRNLNKRDLESLSNNISDSRAIHQIEENQSTTSLVEDAVNDCDKHRVGTSKTFIVQEYQNHSDLKNMSYEISDNCNGQLTKENQNGENLNENRSIEKFVNGTCKTSEQFENNDTCEDDNAEHQLNENKTKKNKSKSKTFENHDNDLDITSDKFYSTDIIQKYHKNTDIESLYKSGGTAECGGNQPKENHLQKIVENDTTENYEIEADDILETFNSSNIVQDDHNNPGLESLSSSVTDGCDEYQTKENQGRGKNAENDTVENRDDDKNHSNTGEDHNNTEEVHKHTGFGRLPKINSAECGDNQSKNKGEEKIVENDTIEAHENDANEISETLYSGQKERNNPVLESLSNSGRQTKENQGAEKNIQNDAVGNCFNDTNKISETFHNSNIRQEDHNNTDPERLSKSVSAEYSGNKSKENHGGEIIVKHDMIENHEKDADETSETLYSGQKERNNPVLESLSNSGRQTKENQGAEKNIQNDAVGNCDNDTNKISETFHNSNIMQEDHNNTDPEWLSKSVSAEYSDNKSKENHGGETIVEHDMIENHEKDADEISETFYCSNIVQENHNNPGLKSLSNNVSDGCDVHQTKENQDGQIFLENDTIESRDNDTNKLSETLYNSNIIQENHSFTNLSKNVTDNCAGYETKQVQDGEIMIENRNNNAAKTFNTANSSSICCEFVKIQHESQNNPLENSRIVNRVSDSCTHLKEDNQSEEILSENVVEPETLEGIGSKFFCKDDNLVKKNQNIVSSESLSKSIFSNSDCIEHHRDKIGSKKSCFGDVTRECDNTDEPFDNSSIVQADKNNLRSEILSENVLEISTEHQTQEKQDEVANKLIENGMIKNCNHNTSPENLSYSVCDACTRYHRENNESRESLTEIKTKNRDSIIVGTSGTFGNAAREDMTNPNLKSLSNMIFENNANYQTDDSQNGDNFLESEIVLNYIESNIATSFQKYHRHKNDNAPDRLIQENRNDNNLGNLLKNKKNTSLNETNIVTDDIFVQCESNTDNICYGKVENDQVHLENNVLNTDNQENSIRDSQVKRRLSLKRSLSDSALYSFKNNDDKQSKENTPLIWPPKRARMYELENSQQMNVIDENLCSFVQNNRRNSVSSFYNAENVSFCILIDNNCIITEENEEEKVCFAEISEECITEINTASEENNESEIICCSRENELDFSDSVILDYGNEKSIQEAWLDDVACVETVVSDDIEDDVVISSPGSPRDIPISEYNESGIFDEVNFINEETLPSNVYQIEETYQSSHEDVIKTLYDKEPQGTDLCNVFYSGNCLEKILSESTSRDCSPSPTHITYTDYNETKLLPDATINSNISESNKNVKNITPQNYEIDIDQNIVNKERNENHNSEDIYQTETSGSISQNVVQSFKSNMDSVFRYKKVEDCNYATSSSPEVSSTTFEEKNSSILLKITNYNGSRVSEVNEVNHNRRPRCKFTEDKEYSNSNGSFPKRPLITKAAQKYIPPLKESICDLKVKLALPQQRLLKLKQFKMSISEPKVMKQNKHILAIPKKPKPKPNFEDVLKNIDEVQIKMHKEKSKKGKNIVPKVVIKKNLNGSHYTSSLNKDTYNPDLTGRKWQPWVFLEKNRFIDNMASTNKTKAIFSHRRNTYVLAEKFKKYKSVSNCGAKFVISQPITSDSSRGQLKYTIKLKHTY